MEKTQFVKFTSPAAHAIWPKLSSPDSYKGGPLNYNVKLRIPADDPFVEEMREQAEACFAEQKAKLEKVGNKKAARELASVGYPFAAELDDNGDPTGYVKVSFKRDAVKFDKETKREIGRVVIPIFDGAGNRLEGVDIWGGSEIRVSGWISSYYFPANKSAGAALRISAVQVLKLVTGGGAGNPEDFGFATDGEAIVVAPAASGKTASGTDDDGDAADEPVAAAADF